MEQHGLEIPGYTEIKPIARGEFFAYYQGVDIEGIPKALALERIGAQQTLILQAEPGITLAQLVKEKKPSLEIILTLAIRLVTILAKIHRGGIIHKDIKPDN